MNNIVYDSPNAMTHNDDFRHYVPKLTCLRLVIRRLRYFMQRTKGGLKYNISLPYAISICIRISSSLLSMQNY